MVTIVRHYAKALSKYGVQGTFIQLYNFGHVKFGDHVGTDEFGNQYFENGVDYPIGQNRWVLYKDVQNPEPSMVPADWHSWLHAMTDTVPSVSFWFGIHLPAKLSSDPVLFSNRTRSKVLPTSARGW